MSLRHRTSQTSERKPGAVRSSDIFRSFYNFCQQLSDNYHMFFNAHMWDEQHLSKMVHFIWIHMAYPYRFWLSLVENHPKTSQKHRILPSSDPLQLQGTAQRVRIWGSSSSMATQASGCPSKQSQKTMDRSTMLWVNPLFRLGHGFNSFLYVYQVM